MSAGMDGGDLTEALCTPAGGTSLEPISDGQYSSGRAGSEQSGFTQTHVFLSFSLLPPPSGPSHPPPVLAVKLCNEWDLWRLTPSYSQYGGAGVSGGGGGQPGEGLLRG